MAREGYLIIDSDLHFNEPEDLWARYLDAPYRANAPRFFGGQKQALKPTAEDKGNADSIRSMEVQGLTIPAFATSQGATASSRELRRRSRARHPHFSVAKAQGFDAATTLTAMDIEGIDVAVMYGTRGRQILCHDDLAPDRAAALARAYNNWAYDYCQADPQRLKFAAQIAMHDVKRAVEETRRCVKELGAVAVIARRIRSTASIYDGACEPLWTELERLDVPIGFHPTGNSSLKDDIARRYVDHANFFPIAHAIRNPVELDGSDCEHDHRRRPRTPPEVGLRVSRRNSRMGALVAVAARRSVGEVRARLRISVENAAERVFQAPVLHRARCG